MKYALILFFSVLYLFAIDDARIDQEIANTTSVEELTTKMQNAPKEDRPKYIRAIQDKVARQNEERRQQKMEALEKEKQTLQNAVNAIGGRGGGNSGGNGNGGSGHGGGHGGGGGKGGRK